MYEYQRLKIILEELSIRKSMTLPEIQELLGGIHDNRAPGHKNPG